MGGDKFFVDQTILALELVQMEIKTLRAFLLRARLRAISFRGIFTSPIN